MGDDDGRRLGSTTNTKPSVPIIDVHAHLWKGNLRREMIRNNVCRAFVMASYASGLPRTTNTKVLEECQRSRGTISGMLSYPHQKDSETFVSELENILPRKNVAGFKLYPSYYPYYPTDKRFDALYAYAERKALPVTIHSGDTYNGLGLLKFSNPLLIDELADRYPKLKIIIAHFGNPWMTEAAEVAYKRENVYVNTSGMILPSQSEALRTLMSRRLSESILYCSADKVLFGSDRPVTPIALSLELIPQTLSGEDLRKILHDNAVRVFSPKGGH